jgi:hypothetical protein
MFRDLRKINLTLKIVNKIIKLEANMSHDAILLILEIYFYSTASKKLKTFHFFFYNNIYFVFLLIFFV